MNYWIKLSYIDRYSHEIGHLANVKDYSGVADIMSRYSIDKHQISRIEINGKEVTLQELKNTLGG